MVYLDDEVCALKNENETTMASNCVKETLAKTGWVYNEVKSVSAPTHKLEWLGFDLDLGQGCISVPTRKINVIKANLVGAATTLRAKS